MINVGSAVGYLKLDTSNFTRGFATAQQHLHQFQNKSNSMGSRLQSVGRGLSSIGSSMTKYITLPLAAIGTGAVLTTAKFESAMSEVKAISGATGKDFQLLSNRAKEMGAKTKFSASESAAALKYMAMAGWDTKKMYDALPGVMNLAAASGEELATVSDIVTDAMTAFGMKADQAGHFADVLAQASSKSNTNVGLMGDTFKYVAPVAGALGYTCEDTALAIGLMANAGIKGSQAGTALRSTISRLAKPTGEVKKAMKDLGISITNADGTMKPFRQVLLDMRQKFSGLTKDQKAQYAATLAGQEGMSGLLAIVTASDEDFNALAKSIDNANGSAERMAETMQDNLQGQWTILKSTLEGIAISFGEIMLPAIKLLVKMFQKLATALNNMSPFGKKVVVIIASILAVTGPLLLVIGGLLTKIGTLINFWPMIAPALSGVGAALGGILAPALLIGGAIIVLVKAFKHLWKTNEGFRKTMTGLWDDLKSKISSAVKHISSVFSKFGITFKSVTKLISKLWTGLCDLLAPVFTAVFTIITSHLSGVIDFFTGLFDVIVGIFTGNGDLIKSGLSSMVQGIFTALSGLLEGLWVLIKDGWNVILGWFGTSWQEIGDTLKGIWTSITDAVSSVWETIKNVVTVGVMLVRSILKAAFDIITLPFRFIWENCKDTIISVWETIKGAIQSALEYINNTVIQPILTVIQSVFTTVWNAIKDFLIARWETLKGNALWAWGLIRDYIVKPMQDAWGWVKDIVSKIYDSISDKFNAVKSTVSGIFDSIYKAIKSPLDKAWSAVSNIIDRIKSKFNFSWSLPHLKLPHPRISGKFSLNPPSVPKFGIEWYAKAMSDGMILNNPTIFGMKNGKFLGGGEAGSETVVGTSNLLTMIRKATWEATIRLVDVVKSLLITYYEALKGVIPTDITIDMPDFNPTFGLDYNKLASILEAALKTLKLGVDVYLEDGDVVLDGERVGRKLAPIVSRVQAQDRR